MKLTQDQIDDMIDQWHMSDSSVELHEYLGWSLHDYNTWVLDPTFIPESKQMNSVFDDLVIDIITNCNTNAFTANKIVNFLRGEGILDYDILKEYYDEGEDEDEI